MKDHKLAAIVFTDIVGYTKQMGENEQLTLELLQKQREIIFPVVEQYGGKVIKEIGDGLLMMFYSANEAVRFSIDVQKQLVDEELTIRAGIHIGDVIFENEDVFGSAVNTAARIEPLAQPNGICISEDVRSQIRNQKDIFTVSCGKKELKGVDEPIEIFQVLIDEKEIETQIQGIPFYKDLWQRRVFQILGIYLGISFLIKLAMVSVVSSNLWSPYLVELAWTILLSLVPSVLILSYFHGKKGVSKWSKVELIGMPLNVIVATVILVFIFKGKDLGAATASITLENEEGEKIERTIVKHEFRKKIALFFYDNISSDSSLYWMQYAVPMTLNYDLSQNTFIQTGTGLRYLRKFREAGFQKGIGASFVHLKDIATYFKMNYFVTGTINYRDQNYILTTKIYNTENATLLSSFETKGPDFFILIDEISKRLVKELKLPTAQIEQAKDLPIGEIYTKSTKALRNYVVGTLQQFLYNDWHTAVRHIEDAIEEDPEFTLAHFTLADYYFKINNVSKAEESLNKTMENLIKLPERMRFSAKLFWYVLKQEPDKAMAVLKMWTELYPQDIEAHDELAGRYTYKNMFAEAIKEYQTILRLDPEQTKYLRVIGEAFHYLGNPDSAIVYFNRYVKKQPEDYRGYKIIAEHYMFLGDFDKADAFLEKAMILEPMRVDLALNKAKIDIRRGDFEPLEKDYIKLFKLCTTIQDSGKVQMALSDYYELRGQTALSLEYYKMFLKGLDQYITPIHRVVNNLFHINKYVIAGKEKEAVNIIKEAESFFEPPVDKVVAFGYMFYYIAVDSAILAEPYIEPGRELAIGFGEEVLLSNIHFVEGHIFEAKGQFKNAVESFSRFLELSPEGINVHYDLARCLRKQGKLKNAKKHIQTTLTNNPWNPKYNYEAALIQSDLGNDIQAQEFLKRACEVWGNSDQGYKPALDAQELLSEYTKE